MDNNSAEKFMNELIAKASEYGFEESEVSVDDNISMNIGILNGEVSEYENSTDQSVTFRGLKNNQMGYSFASSFDEDTVKFLLESASENCDVLSDEDTEIIYCDKDNKNLHYSQVSTAYDKNSYQRFEEIGLSIEKAILALDQHIDAVDYLDISCSRSKSMICNSKGLNSYLDFDVVSIYAQARATDDNGNVKTGGHYWMGRDIDDFNMDSFLVEFKSKLISKLGAKSCGSGTYEAIFTSEAFEQLLSTFAGSFSSDAMQKGLSLLNGREGEVIASPKLTIREVPMYEKALIKMPFDSEGVLTKEKDIIKDGVFETALYNLKTAAKAGRESTGNGFKKGSAIGISFTNVLVAPGNRSRVEMAADITKGIVITDLSGLHAGVNPISGDFSLLCEGFLIENGKIGRPVEQITVADNFYTIIKKIKEVGNDIINIPSGIGDLFCPSVMVEKLSISGEA